MSLRKIFDYQNFTFIIVVLALLSCTSPPDTLGDLDLKTWRRDKAGCENLRKEILADFKSSENLLLGKFADDIGGLLGKPDIQQLGNRNQKYYIYFLEKGAQCDDKTRSSEALKAILHFNAVGLLSEITYDRTLY